MKLVSTAAQVREMDRRVIEGLGLPGIALMETASRSVALAIARRHRAEAERGVVVKVLPLIPETGTLDLDRFPELLSGRTKLVALGAASNALGTLTDVGPLARLARETGARVFLDAVHLAPHRRIDVRALGCDFLTCSPYKFYGPHMGVLWMRRELLAEMDVPKVVPAPDAGPERFESGTVNAEGMAGTTAAVEFLAKLVSEGTKPKAEAALTRSARLDVVFSELAPREGALLARLWDGLAETPGVRLYGPPPGPDRARSGLSSSER